MEAIGTTLNRMVDKATGEILPNATPPSSSDLQKSAPSATPNERASTSAYTCFRCKDQGWIVSDVPVGNKDFGKATRCPCQTGNDFERRRSYLHRIDGLSPAERAISFGDLEGGDNDTILRQVQEAASRRRGLITLTGKPGTGKSSMLISAVNAARDANVPAVYTTITDLLDYLRQAYAPGSQLDFDDRWDLLIRCEVLALDELDEFNTTPWAMERFLRLIDERWRAMDRTLTLCATNSRLSAMPEKVASRLRDGRGYVFDLKGADMRPYQDW